MKIILLLVAVFGLAGCASIDPQVKLDRATRVCVTIKTDDFLQSELPSKDAVRAFANRIAERTAQYLERDHIRAVSADRCGPQDAHLTIELTTLESLGGRKSKVLLARYRVAFDSPAGEPRLAFRDHAKDGSLDEIVKDIAGYVTKNVTAYYH